MRNKNKLFDALYSEFYHSGSSYIGLKIAEPDEFDLNLILKLPFKVHEFEVTLLLLFHNNTDKM